MVNSGIPSPFVSHAKLTVVVTVLPGRCNGTPVSDEKLEHIVVVSFGKKLSPSKFNCTEQIALIMPDVGITIILPLASLWLLAAGEPISGCPGATAIGRVGITLDLGVAHSKGFCGQAR